MHMTCTRDYAHARRALICSTTPSKRGVKRIGMPSSGCELAVEVKANVSCARQSRLWSAVERTIFWPGFSSSRKAQSTSATLMKTELLAT